jgi:flagellar hook assembly protein FlgD
VLGADGTVVRQIAKPAHAAGQVSVPYYGYTDSGTRLPAGTYRVLVVASNASGSASAETTLTISAP